VWKEIVRQKLSGVHPPELQLWRFLHSPYCAPVYKWICKAEKFLKLFLGGEHLCAFLWSKYVWKEIVRRKLRGVHLLEII